MYYTVETELSPDVIQVLAHLTDIDHVCELIRCLLRPTVAVPRALRVSRHPEDPPKFLGAA